MKKHKLHPENYYLFLVTMGAFCLTIGKLGSKKTKFGFFLWNLLCCGQLPVTGDSFTYGGEVDKAANSPTTGPAEKPSFFLGPTSQR